MTARIKRPRIGFHASIGGGLHQALLSASELNCQTVQIFSRNPRGWQAKALTEEDISKFKATRRLTKISPVVIHANYLINLSAADPLLLEKSRASFREEVERGIALGADYLVVHPGSARGASETAGIAICGESLKVTTRNLDLGKFRILLENTAGQGDCIGHRFEHLRDLLATCIDLRLGVCLDTAHTYTAGYDIREEEGLAATMQVVKRTVGARNIRVVHFNDSRAAYNSRVDRHWHIGQGHIGSEALRRVARDPRLKHAAFILETPIDPPADHIRNVETLRSFLR
jgi:deoxyribonuclease IV